MIATTASTIHKWKMIYFFSNSGSLNPKKEYSIDFFFVKKILVFIERIYKYSFFSQMKFIKNIQKGYYSLYIC